MAKDITYNVEAREALKRGVDQLADFCLWHGNCHRLYVRLATQRPTKTR